MKTCAWSSRNVFQDAILFGVLMSATLATAASATSLHTVSRTDQMRSFKTGGPSRSEVFHQQWAEGAAQCRESFPQTTSVQLGRVDSRAINARTFQVTGKWICRG